MVLEDLDYFEALQSLRWFKSKSSVGDSINIAVDFTVARRLDGGHSLAFSLACRATPNSKEASPPNSIDFWLDNLGKENTPLGFAFGLQSISNEPLRNVWCEGTENWQDENLNWGFWDYYSVETKIVFETTAVHPTFNKTGPMAVLEGSEHSKTSDVRTERTR